MFTHDEWDDDASAQQLSHNLFHELKGDGKVSKRKKKKLKDLNTGGTTDKQQCKIKKSKKCNLEKGIEQSGPSKKRNKYKEFSTAAAEPNKRDDQRAQPCCNDKQQPLCNEPVATDPASRAKVKRKRKASGGNRDEVAKKLKVSLGSANSLKAKTSTSEITVGVSDTVGSSGQGLDKKKKKRKTRPEKNKYKHLAGQKSTTGAILSCDNTQNIKLPFAAVDNNNASAIDAVESRMTSAIFSADISPIKKRKRVRNSTHLDVHDSSQSGGPQLLDSDWLAWFNSLNHELREGLDVEAITTGGGDTCNLKRTVIKNDQVVRTVQSEAVECALPVSKKKHKLKATTADNIDSKPAVNDKKCKGNKTGKSISSVPSEGVCDALVEKKSLRSNDGFNITKLKTILSTASTSEHSTRDKEDTLSTKSIPKDTPCQGRKSKGCADSLPCDNTGSVSKAATEVKSVKTPLTLAERMKQQLQAARFRYLNEQLYTRSSCEAQQLLREDADAFAAYHRGFEQQVSKWPENPVRRAITYIRALGRAVVVADLGCGDAKIALALGDTMTVHSFDLVALNARVTACDMARVPLPAHSVDVGVFCLALMGTNVADFVCEANRVMRKGAVLLVAEVVSRFEKVGHFVSKMAKLGFTLENKDTTNKMFIWFEFRKTGPLPPSSKVPEIILAPCFYKRR